MNPQIWSAYRRTLCLAREHLAGEERATSMLSLRNVVRLEYLRYEGAAAEDVAPLVAVHEQVNDVLQRQWETWTDPIESSSFKHDWQRETRHMDESQAKQHYQSLLEQRATGMRAFNTTLDTLLLSRPPVPESASASPTPDWRIP